MEFSKPKVTIDLEEYETLRNPKEKEVSTGDKEVKERERYMFRLLGDVLKMSKEITLPYTSKLLYDILVAKAKEDGYNILSKDGFFMFSNIK